MLDKYFKYQRKRLFVRSLLEGFFTGISVSAAYALVSAVMTYTFNPQASFVVGGVAFVLVTLFRFFLLFPRKRLARYVFLNVNEEAEKILAAVFLERERSIRNVNDVWLTAFEDFISALEEKGETLKKVTKFPVTPAPVFGVLFIAGLSLWITASLYIARLKEPELKIAKNIVLKVEPPSYTGMAEFEVTDFSLPVSVPFGAALTVKALPEKGITRMKAVIKDASFPCFLSSEVFTCRLTIVTTGRAVIKLKGFRGVKWFVHPQSLLVEIVPDKKPKVRLIEPARDLSLTRPEPLKITFEAGDDYAVKKAALIYRLNGANPVTQTIELTSEQKHLIHSFTWDLKKLPDAEVIEAWIAVWDNNPFIDGGAKATTRVLTIEVMTPLRRFKAFIKALSKVLDRGIELLGFLIEKIEMADTSELPLHHLKKLENELFKEYARAQEIITELSDMTQGWIKNVDLHYSKLKQAVQERRKAEGTGMFRITVRAERENTEDFVYVLDKFIREQTLEVIKHEIEKLLKKKEELISRLERGEDPEKILQELQLLERRLRELLQELAAQMAEYSDEFYNTGTHPVTEMPAPDTPLLQQIKDALKRGDMKKAKELLNKYFQSLEDFYSKLDELNFRTRMGMMQQMKTLSEVMSEIKTLSEMQKKILNRHMQELESQNNLGSGRLGEIMEEFKRDLQKAESEFNSYSQNRGAGTSSFMRGFLNFGTVAFQRAMEALNRGDVKEVQSELNRLNDLLNRLPINDPQIRNARRYLQDSLNKLKRLEEMGLSEDIRGQLAEEEGRVASRLSQLLRKADELGSEELMEKLQGAKESADSAGEFIKGNRHTSALLKEQEVIKYLEEAKNELEKLTKEMASGKMAYLLQQLEIMGRGDVRVGEVKIPEEEKYRIKEELRRMINNALKLGLPEENRDKNERYYHEIVE